MAAKGTRARTLATAVILLTVLVLGLGGAVVALKLRPPDVSGGTESLVGRWEAAAAANPDDEWAQVGLGLALVETGQKEGAREAFERALGLNPKNWVAMFRLGLLLGEDAPDRAVSLLQDAGEEAPRTDKAGPFVALGDLLLARGEADEARRAFRNAVADLPFLMDARLGLARALEALGEVEGALEQYRLAARLDPSNEEITEAIRRLEG